MLRTSRAGAAALLAAPAAAILSAIVQPTLSDDPAQQLSALTAHRAAAIASLTLNTVAIALLIAGVIWLAVAIRQRAPRLAVAGGSLGVFGSLIVLFQNGIAAAAPSVVRGLDPTAATAALERVHSSLVVSGLEPLSLLGDLGLAVLGVGAVRAGAPRPIAALIAVGAFGEGIGFATATRPLVIASLVILLIGLVQAVRTLLASPMTLRDPDTRARGKQICPLAVGPEPLVARSPSGWLDRSPGRLAGSATCLSVVLRHFVGPSCGGLRATWQWAPPRCICTPQCPARSAWRCR